MTGTPRFEDHLRELASLPEKAGDCYYRISQALDSMRAPFTAEMIRLIADVIADARAHLAQPHAANARLRDSIARLDAHYRDNK
jgi:hypothetical protein